MGQESIPQDVRQFVAACVDSVGQLEVLLLLHGRADRAWTAAQGGEELRVDAGWVTSQLDDLCRRGILARAEAAEPQYRFTPADPAVGRTIASLAALYTTHRVTIISMIFSTPPVDTLRTFADAFRLRKDPTDG